MVSGTRRRLWSAAAITAAATAMLAATTVRLDAQVHNQEVPRLRVTTDTHSVTLVLVGDTGEPSAARDNVAQAIDERCARIGGCSAVFLLGDNFYPYGVSSSTDPKWQSHFEQVFDLPALSTTPFFALFGNHDYGITSTGSKQAQLDYAQLSVGSDPGQRPSSKWHMPAAYYDVRFGPIHVFALDTQDASMAQSQLMGRRVAASPAPWKIVLGHHPRFSSGRHAQATALWGSVGVFDMIDDVVCQGAQLYVAGHDHNLEFIQRGRLEQCPQVHFATSGGGSEARQSTAPPQTGQAFFRATEGFLITTAMDHRLELGFFDQQGQSLFETTLDN